MTPRHMTFAERFAVQGLLEECLARPGKALTPDVIWGPLSIQAERIASAQQCLDWPCILVVQDGTYRVVRS